MSQLLQQMQALTKALEAGQITGAPGTLVQGSALQIQEAEGVMHNVTFGEEDIKLQKLFSTVKARNTLVRFKRQLSYGEFGGSAQMEGAVGQEETGDYVEAIVPICYYSHLRRVTLAAQSVEAFDGVKAEDREAENAAMKIAADMEFDSFQGKAHFSNDGVFDGDPGSIPALPNLTGLDCQVRQSDLLSNTQDAMFAEFGSSESVVLNAGGGTLTQPLVEEAGLRSKLNFGRPAKIVLDPVTLADYNKLVYATTGNVYQHAVMGNALTSSGADLRTQATTSGSLKLDDSHFLRGKYQPRRPRSLSPASPLLGTPAAGGTGIIPAGVYIYRVSAENERGEGLATNSTAVTVSGSQAVTMTITAQGMYGTRFFNVYRTAAGGAANTAKFVGRVANSQSGAVTFTDLGNKSPAFVNAYVLDERKENGAIHELLPYFKAKMAVQDLSEAQAHARFAALAIYRPRRYAIVDNLKGTIR